MRIILPLVLLALAIPAACCASLACSDGPSCGLADWISYPTELTLANDAGTEVWVAHYSGHSILRFDPIGCQALDWVSLPGGPGSVSGLARDGETLWYVIHADGRIYHVDTSDWSLLASFPSPAQVGDGDAGHGIAWDGQHLWHSDGTLNVIYKLDPATGAVLDSFSAPSNWAWGLEWADGVLYLGDHTGDAIIAIDPVTYDVLGVCDPPMSGSQGVAARPDGRYWFLSATFFEVHDLWMELTTPVERCSWGTAKSLY